MKLMRIFTMALAAGLTLMGKGQCSPTVTAMNTSGSTVDFTVQPASSGTYISHTWQFGDNSGYFVSVNSPTYTHIYPGNGIYTYTVSYSDSSSSTPCFTTVAQTVVVSNSSCNDSINFSYTPGANGMVYFYGGSWNNPNYAYTWHFGDGDSSNIGSPQHTYSLGGTYTVILKAVTQPSALCTYTMAKVITVSVVPCPVNASFSSTVSGNTATLVSTSTGTSASSWYHWHLGDGNQAYGPSVVHTYSNGGVYIAGLTVVDSSNVMCQDSVMQSVGVWSGTCLISASYVIAKDSSQAFTWYIYPYINSSISNAQWSWGDGSTSNTLYTSHTFSAAGMYNICLSLTATCGSDTSICTLSNIYRSQGSQVISVTVVDPVSGIGEQALNSGKLNIVPNPSNGQIKLLLPYGMECRGEIRVFDMLGREVLTEASRGGENNAIPLDLNALNAGTYYIVLSGDTGTYRGKVVLLE